MRCHSILVVIATLLIVKDVNAQGLLGSITSAAFNLLGKDTDEGQMDPCSDDQTDAFANAISDFTNTMIGHAIDHEVYHFVMSPYSMWMSLAAMAEGAIGPAKGELFEILGLPVEECVRDAFYDLAVGLEYPGEDVQFSGRRVLLLDKHSRVDRRWAEMAHNTGLLDLKYAKLHPDSSKQRVNFNQLDIEGNSIILDDLNIEALWTTAFSKTRKVSDFYDEQGKVIGQVELMTVTKQVRMAHLPSLDAKILELPVGENGRYTMLIAMGLTTMPIKSLMTLFQHSGIGQVLSALTLNLLPIDIAIPEINMRSVYTAKPILEDLGVKALWYDPRATRLVSNPPALPDNLYQRITVSLSAGGVNPAPADKADNILTGLLHTATSLTAKTASLIGRDFIANKPFTYCLLDTNTKAIIFAGLFSDPN